MLELAVTVVHAPPVWRMHQTMLYDDKEQDEKNIGNKDVTTSAPVRWSEAGVVYRETHESFVFELSRGEKSSQKKAWMTMQMEMTYSIWNAHYLYAGQTCITCAPGLHSEDGGQVF